MRFTIMLSVLIFFVVYGVQPSKSGFVAWSWMFGAFYALIYDFLHYKKKQL